MCVKCKRPVSPNDILVSLDKLFCWCLHVPQWEPQHDSLDCDKFAEWKALNDPNAQEAGLAAHLNANGIGISLPYKHTHSHTQIVFNTHKHACTHPHTCTHSLTLSHTHTHTHIHTHTQSVHSVE